MLIQVVSAYYFDEESEGMQVLHKATTLDVAWRTDNRQQTVKALPFKLEALCELETS